MKKNNASRLYLSFSFAPSESERIRKGFPDHLRKNSSIAGLLFFLLLPILCFMNQDVFINSCSAITGSTDRQTLYQKISVRDQDILFAEKLFDRGLTDLALSNALSIYDLLKNNAPLEISQNKRKFENDLFKTGALILKIKTEKWFSAGPEVRSALDREIAGIRSFIESNTRLTEVITNNSDSNSNESIDGLSEQAFSENSVFCFLKYLDAWAGSAVRKSVLLHFEKNDAKAAALLESLLKDLQQFQKITDQIPLVSDALLFYRIQALQEAAIASPDDSRKKILNGIAQNVSMPNRFDNVYRRLLRYLIVRNTRLLKNYNESDKMIGDIYKSEPDQMTLFLVIAEKLRGLTDSGKIADAVGIAKSSLSELKQNNIPLKVKNSRDSAMRQSLDELLSAMMETFLADGKIKRTESLQGYKKEIEELTGLLDQGDSFRRRLITGLLTEQGGANELEKLGKEAWLAGDSEKAVSLYDRAANEARSKNDHPAAFRLTATAAGILDQKFRQSVKEKKDSDELIELQKEVMARFLKLSFENSNEETSEKLADYGLTLADNLHERNRLSTEELIQILNKRVQAFPNSSQTPLLNFQKELLYLEKNTEEKGEAFLAPDNARNFLTVLDSAQKKQSDLPLFKNRPVRFFEAEAYFKIGQDQEALNRFAALLRDWPDNIGCQEKIALILTRQSDPKVSERALFFWNEVVKKSKTGSRTWLRAKKNIISIYEKTDRKDLAEKMRNILLLTYPDFEKIE